MKLTKEKLYISGMHCSGCTDRVSKVLQNIAGVRSAEVSLEREQAVVDYDSDQTGFPQFKEAIEQAGYQAQPTTNK